MSTKRLVVWLVSMGAIAALVFRYEWHFVSALGAVLAAGFVSWVVAVLAPDERDERGGDRG